MAAILLYQQCDSVISGSEKTGSLITAAICKGSSASDEEYSNDGTPSHDSIKYNKPRRIPSKPPIISRLEKFYEYTRIGAIRARSLIKENQQPYCALSLAGKFAHDYVEPLSTCWGNNERIVVSQYLSSVNILAEDGSFQRVVNGASQNYVGFYEMTPQSEELQRLCLALLPVADSSAVPLLAGAANKAVADFMDADFCIFTATGYGSNYFSLPAIIDSKTLIIMDENSHSSLLTGAYLARPGKICKFAHNDANNLEEILKGCEGSFDKTVLVIEGMYSMEGDVPPLNEIQRLKEAYNFIIFCDEAHSFFSIGSTGRGCVQYWNEENPEILVPWNLVDITTATFSKAVGGVGGFICGKAQYEGALRQQIARLEDRQCETLSTSQMVQVLWVLGQPSRTARYLARLADVSPFCRSELQRFGIHVYGDDATHIIPIHTGRVTLATKLSYILRDKGVLAVPISAPGVPFWQSRVRLNLSAAHSDEEIEKLLDAIIGGCKSIGVCQKEKVKRRDYAYTPELYLEDREMQEMWQTFSEIFELIAQSAENLASKEKPFLEVTSPKLDRTVIQRGHDSRATYGLGSGGSRWILTFPPHLAVERLIAKRTELGACMTYPDSNIGLASIIAALSRPLIGYPHYMLLPENVAQPVADGLVIASKNGRPEVVRYRDLEQLYQLTKLLSRCRKSYFTVYIQVLAKSPSISVSSTISKLCESKSPIAGLTVLLDSLASILSAVRLDIPSKLLNLEVLVCGSFYKTFGLPRGYLVGSETLIQELRYTTRGYMFTTSTQPFIMDMIHASLGNQI